MSLRGQLRSALKKIIPLLAASELPLKVPGFTVPKGK